MLNGKFFTGLPAKMVEKRQTLNRQETHFFWPDDTQSVSTVDSKNRRRANSVQPENRNVYNNNGPRADNSISDSENKERFKKEFTRSSIQFYDNDAVDQTPVRRNRKQLTVPPQKLLNGGKPEVDTLAKKKENLSSKIQFFDNVEDLNNVPKTNKNNKVELEKNSKNSPKLQNKNLSFDSNCGDEAIKFIENDVRNMKIVAPSRSKDTVRESRPRYERQPVNHYPTDEPLYTDIHDDYIPPPRRRLHPPPIMRSSYPESDPDYDEYIPRRAQPLPPFYRHHEPLQYGHYRDNDYYDARPSVPLRKNGRQMHYSEAYSSANEYSNNYDEPQSHSRSFAGTAIARHSRKVNISKVDNNLRNNELRQQLRDNNTCLSDTETARETRPPAPAPTAPTAPIATSTPTSASTRPPPPTTIKRNIRSSAVNRVSVGLPD